MDRKVTVYTLSSSRDDEVRYVGQTVQPLKNRLNGHKHSAKRYHRTAVQRWIVRELGESFEISILPINADSVWNETEIDYITLYRAYGFDLLNLTEGGEGIVGFPANKGIKRPYLSERNRQNTGKPGHPMSAENKAKLIASVTGTKRPYLAERNRESKVWLGRKHSEESKAKIGAAHKGMKHSEETKEKMRTARIGKKHTEESKAKMRESHKKTVLSAEARQRMVDAPKKAAAERKLRG